MTKNGTDLFLTKSISAPFFRKDIHTKAGSEIEDIKDASRLLGHSTEGMTKKVYYRVEERNKGTDLFLTKNKSAPFFVATPVRR